MEFDIWSFALQLVNFLILVWLLQRFLYQPVRRIIEQRRTAVDSKVAEAEKARKTAEDEKDRLAAANVAFEEEKRARLDKLHGELEAEKARVVGEAQKKAQALIDDSRKQIESERADALKTMEGEVAVLAADMVAKILTARPTEPTAIIAKFEDYARALPEDERRNLARSAAAGVKIVSALPLDANGESAWRDALARVFGASVDATFANDPSLIAGADLHFPHAVIKLSAADALAKLKEGALGK